MILIFGIWNYLLMCLQKELLFTGSRLRDIKIQGNITVHASLHGNGVYTKEYTSFLILQMNGGITKNYFVLRDSSTMQNKTTNRNSVKYLFS